MEIPFNIESEFIFIASRSSGAGGQNVNKVNTKVELRFAIYDSLFLTENQKKVLSYKLKNRINNDGILIVTAQTERSQIKNKQIAIQKVFQLIKKALQPEKPRIKTKPTRASKEKRMENKQKLSQKKANRKKIM